MFENLKKYLEEKNRKYLTKELMIFIKSKNVKEEFNNSHIDKNRDYLFVGYLNNDETKVKNVLTGEVCEYKNNSANKNGAEYIKSTLQTQYIKSDFYFEPIGTVAYLTELDYDSVACKIVKNKEITHSDIEKFVSKTNNAIDRTIKQEVKEKALREKSSNESKLSDKDRMF